MHKALLVCTLCAIFFVGCSSKKNGPTPTPAKHTIKVTANASQEYNTGVWVRKNDGTALGTPLDAKTQIGSYEFTTTAEVGQTVFYELQSNNNTDLTYSIFDNGKEIVTVTHLNLNNNRRSALYLVK